jgi:pyruvate/2-oxoacid:ferredoxin oxidoreductase alpha subunit
VTELRQGLREVPGTAPAGGAGAGSSAAIREQIAQRHWGKAPSRLSAEQQRLADKMTAMVCAKMVSVDMDGIMREVTGSATVVSNLVAVGPMFQALQAMGFDFDWEPDLKILTQGFPDAVIKNKKLLNQYYQAMERARERSGIGATQDAGLKTQDAGLKTQDPRLKTQDAGLKALDSRMEPAGAGGAAAGADPGEYLMIMGGTLAGMVLSQVALPENPLFYVGFPITPAGNPFYAMADAYANGHPYIVVDEVNPSEKVAAEKLMGIARNGGWLPVTFTASQGWRLFTEIIPQFVGARLEGLFLIAKRALAAPNLNIEESHTDFMSFRDDGGIMLAPKGIQEYVSALYLARLLTHFAKLPVIVSIGGITDTHKIGLIRVPADDRVRTWLRKTLAGFDFLEHKLINRQGEVVVHGPSGTSAVYQETQSELEKAHLAVTRIYRYALEAVHELTGVWIDELEVQVQGLPDGDAGRPGRGDAGTRGRGEGERARRGDAGMRGGGEVQTRGRGDAGTRGHGEGEIRR